MADHDDKTVKQLLDAGTRADLERWFGLPSFAQRADAAADAGKAPVPPEQDARFAEVHRRRDAAIAAIDPALVDAIYRRMPTSDDLLRFKAELDVLVDPSIARIDLAMIERHNAHLEPREVEIPYQLEDALTNRTPQALLRDLHRPELEFDKLFEIVDPLAELRVEVAKLVAEAMATRHSLVCEPSVFQEGRALLLELRAFRNQPWIEMDLPNSARADTPEAKQAELQRSSGRAER